MIIIDAGHGGIDPGACANGVREKEWTLEVSLYQYKRFQELGIPVMLTRYGDTTLESRRRANIVKTSGAAICLSNHFNAGGGTGCEVIHSIFSKSILAKTIGRELEAAGMPLRRVFTKSGSSGSDYYYMHRLTGKVKTIIIEYGFLDHEGDFGQLKVKDNRFKYAEAVIKALCDWLHTAYNKGDEKLHLNNHTSGKKLHYVQVGAFEERENAELLVKKLVNDGYPAIIKN